MTPAEKIRFNILSKIFPDFEFNERKKEFVTWCPNPKGCNGRHHKKKLQINIEKNVYNCWVCDYHSHIIKLLHAKAPSGLKKEYIETLPDLISDDGEEELIVQLPEGYKFLLSALDNEHAKRGYRWLKENCDIDDQTIFHTKIGFCDSGDFKNRLIFPSFDADGRLNFFVTRTVFDDVYLKYLDCEQKKRKIVFNEILVDWNKPLILVEGIKAHLRHFDVQNVIPLLGSKLTPKYKLFRECVLNDVPEVYIAIDNDAIDKAYEIMESFYSYGVDIKIVDLSDVNQADMIDTNELLSRLEYARPFSKKAQLVSKLRKVA